MDYNYICDCVSQNVKERLRFGVTSELRVQR